MNMQVRTAVKQLSREILGIRCPQINWVNLPRKFMHPGELETLVALANSVQPKHVIEIGVNEGRTAKALLDNVPSIRMYQGIDVEPGYKFGKSIQRFERPLYPGRYALGSARFELLLRPQGSFDLDYPTLHYADLIFIDGDHSRKAVEHDTQLAFRLIRKGGLIVWHDYHNEGTVDVKPVLDELSLRGFDITHIEHTWLAFSCVR